MKIDRIIARIKAAQKLSDEQKARLVRICERIRAVIAAIRKAIHGIYIWARNHRTFINVMLIAVIVAVILNQIPLVGQTLGTLALLCGAVLAALRQFQASLEEMLGASLN
jgi:hypothetical protein